MPNQQECLQRAMSLLEAADEMEQLRRTLPTVYHDMTTTVRHKVEGARNQVGEAQQDDILDMAAGALVYAENYDTHALELRPVQEKLDAALMQAHDEISLFALQQLLSCAGGDPDEPRKRVPGERFTSIGGTWKGPG